MEIYHIYDLFAEMRDTSIHFINVGLDKYTSCILRDICWVHIEYVLSFSFEILSRDYFLMLSSL